MTVFDTFQRQTPTNPAPAKLVMTFAYNGAWLTADAKFDTLPLEIGYCRTCHRTSDTRIDRALSARQSNVKVSLRTMSSDIEITEFLIQLD